MKVKVKTGFWEVQEYLLSADQSGLLLHADKKDWRIPFSQLVRFTLMGPSDNADRFTLETTTGSYDGRFASSLEARQLVSQLSQYGGQKVEISLTTEESSIRNRK